MSSGGAVAAVVILCVGFGVGVWYYRDHPEALAAFVTAFYQAYNDQNQGRSRSSPAKENESEMPNEVTVAPEDDDSTARTGAAPQADYAMDCTEAEAAEYVTGRDAPSEGEDLPV
jgi:hypothetical protein